MILFWLSIVLMLLIAIAMVLLPGILVRRKDQKNFPQIIIIAFVILLPIVSVSLYLFWGDSRTLQKWYALREQTRELKKELRSPALVIAKMHQELVNHPDNAEGWYLLGKLFLSQRQFQDAAMAFYRAKQLKPKTPEILVQYAQALYFANNYKMTSAASRSLKEVLAIDPDEPLATNLLALEAYHKGHYSAAIGFWEKLLNHYPPSSENYKVISAAIKNAEEKKRAK